MTATSISPWEEFDTVLRGGIPERVPLLHTWGEHPGYVAREMARAGYVGSDEQRYLQYWRDQGHAIGLHVGWWSRLPRGSDEAHGVNRYTAGGLCAGASLKPFENLGDLVALREQCRRVVALNHRYGLGCRANISNCFHAVATAMGLEAFAMALYEDPDWLSDALEQAERYNRRGIQVLIEHGVDIVLFDGDCAYKTGPMVSPEMMRRFWFERTRQTASLLQQAGVRTWYHTDGKVDDILPMLIEIGFDCFHGCEKAANDLGHLKRAFGDRMTLIGNADNAELTFWTPERIAAETEIMVRTGAPGGRYIADINTSVPLDAPLENYDAFVDTVRRVGRYGADGLLAG